MFDFNSMLSTRFTDPPGYVGGGQRKLEIRERPLVFVPFSALLGLPMAATATASAALSHWLGKIGQPL